MSFVYFIQSTNGSTYIGATVNLDKRIRQHNKDIKGGATATSIKVNQGEAWTYVCYVENFPTWNEALKFEWRWKQISRQIQKKNPKQNPREKRLEALDLLLKLDRPTSKAMLYNEWENKPNVVYNT
ncbi:GIY-YIG endonuclease superfamily protein [Chrysochromulina ericina virus CeV-01B]|uniref:GIY-YIG endonuclease superfamily protein n=1 Tax=Chrysochromulina ericina virus CeV-01B TaxID=3070830 RepID=A0A0N9R3G5_9VIRU|nr:GIY-YIG endonuclease superfamily protein [Chrysochromulina ericina virus]ALH23054.1 GIY-YIG endonuclease superfamily protein [Chrysochromulina ericina virus CeV-01B]